MMGGRKSIMLDSDVSFYNKTGLINIEYTLGRVQAVDCLTGLGLIYMAAR
jgi:hypothetical protein